MKAATLLIIFLMTSIPVAFGHGLGEDQSETLNIDGIPINLLVDITPDVLEFDVEELEMKILFKDDRNANLVENVLYELVILNGSDELIFSSQIFSQSGETIIDVIPSDGNMVNIEGQTMGNAFKSSAENRLKISGPLFDRGGLYQITANILEIDSNTVDSENSFLALVTIGEFVPFVVTFDDREYVITCATYFDEIRNFNFDSDDYSFRFEMNFNWDPEFLKNIPYLHSECFIPKTIDSYVFNEISTKINGNDVFTMIDRSGEDEIVIHFLFKNKDLLKMAEKIPDGKNDILFAISPTTLRETAVSEEFTTMSSQQDWKIYLWWEPAEELLPNNDVTFNIMFHNPETNLMVKNIVYDFQVFLDDIMIDSRPESHTFSGHDLQKFTFEDDGIARVYIDNINGVDTNAEFEFFVGNNQQQILIPNWVKNNAEWWVDGQIDDDAFVTGIEFMITQKIIKVPTAEIQSEANSEIPNWVKNNAEWWVDGQIDDKEFASGLQYLIQVGIISI